MLETGGENNIEITVAIKKHSHCCFKGTFRYSVWESAEKKVCLYLVAKNNQEFILKQSCKDKWILTELSIAL